MAVHAQVHDSIWKCQLKACCSEPPHRLHPGFARQFPVNKAHCLHSTHKYRRSFSPAVGMNGSKEQKSCLGWLWDPQQTCHLLKSQKFSSSDKISSVLKHRALECSHRSIPTRVSAACFDSKLHWLRALAQQPWLFSLTVAGLGQVLYVILVESVF